jgi:lipopolysaccharide transport system ATP-binding protein
MSDALIKAESLTKTYRLYRKPLHRFLDAFNLVPDRWLGYREHHALKDVDLTIEAGEKVAIIGRNGAGKSTLLKLMGNVSHPTSGTLRVQGKISALLTLGAGFHQDFTGRENVYAYLSQFGMDDTDIGRIFDGIVDFAELHDYIDQPLKTYSSGMAMRLSFAASTILRPEILIVDEVMSVGDAYFFKKSYERIRDLCTNDGTTLIMVTHDLYSAMTMCDRAIWLDEGRVRADGPVKDVVNVYEASIKEQEEQRLRHKWRETVLRNSEEENRVLFGEIKTVADETVADGFRVSSIEFLDGEHELTTISMDESALDTISGGIVPDAEAGNWGEIEPHLGRQSRPFLPFGSIYQKLPFFVGDPSVLDSMARNTLHMAVNYNAETGQNFNVSLREPEDRSAVLTGEYFAEPGEWRRASFPMVGDASGDGTGIAFARYGQRVVEIKNVRFLDENNGECLQFETNGVFRAEIEYQINDPDFDEKPTILIAFQKDGTLRTHRLLTNDTRLRGQDGMAGKITVEANPIQFTAGTYLLNVSIFAEGFFDGNDTKKFFTVNEKLYDMHSRAYEIVVKPPAGNPLWSDVVFIHKSDWSVIPEKE